MHGLATGVETRQQLYTMLTRGAIANHLYLQVVGDGDLHAIIRPDNVHPPTATDLLEDVLVAATAPLSPRPLRSVNTNPAVRLGDATARYLDALCMSPPNTTRKGCDRRNPDWCRAGRAWYRRGSAAAGPCAPI